jgi:FeS assembly SUF system protein
MYTARAEVDMPAQAALQSAGVFHMMDATKTAGTEIAHQAGAGGAGGAAAAADAAERPPAIPADEIARMGDDIVDALKTVYDPEIPADLYELGLIYKVIIDDDRMVNIDMTLTSPSCPSAAELPGQVQNAVVGVTGVREAKVTIVWDPPWDPSRMSDEARTVLNMW